MRVIVVLASSLLVAPTVGRAMLQERQIGGIGISVFAEPDFRGANATFREDVSDLRRYNLNDRIDSLRVAANEVWEGCEDINYKGPCQIFTGSESDLDRVSWGRSISSLRRVRYGGGGGGRPPRPPYPPGPERLVLFEGDGFRGRSRTLTNEDSSFGSFNDRASSAEVFGGRWEVCEHERFRGRCRVIGGSVSDLGRLDMKFKISSARPLY